MGTTKKWFPILKFFLFFSNQFSAQFSHSFQLLTLILLFRVSLGFTPDCDHDCLVCCAYGIFHLLAALDSLIDCHIFEPLCIPTKNSRWEIDDYKTIFKYNSLCNINIYLFFGVRDKLVNIILCISFYHKCQRCNWIINNKFVTQLFGENIENQYAVAFSWKPVHYE